MYALYCATTNSPVSITIYSKEFKKTDLKFKKPKIDTCSTCDSLAISVKVASDKEKESLNKQLIDHQQDAEDAYSAKKRDKIYAASRTDTALFTFDLQQVLPTPYLTTNKAYYKRQLSTYNLTVHNCVDSTSTHFMWHEGISGRGANEVASCLYNFLTSCIGPEISHIILYSDTCGGQNKNSILSAMYLYLLRSHPTLKRVDHKFLIPGHTHMECDNDHAVIEKKMKTASFSIHQPRDWYQLVRSARPKQPFKVVVMDTDSMFCFKNLLNGPIKWNSFNTNKEKFLWRPVKWLQYESKNIIKYKTSILDDVEFLKINLERKKRVKVDYHWTIQNIYTGLIPIPTQKKRIYWNFCNFATKMSMNSTLI